MPSSLHLDSLSELASASEQKRDAALLRATTDLFVLDKQHGAEELLRFEELALHFLPKVQPADRLFVSTRLATCPDAPRTVIAALARDEIEIATPVILSSPVLTDIDILALIGATDGTHHRAVARRSDLSADVVYALRLAKDPPTIALLEQRIRAKWERVRAPAPDGSEARGRMPARTDSLDPWRFLGLDRKNRIAVVAALASRQATTTSSIDATPDRAFRTILGAARIVGFARNGQLPAIVATISESLDIPRDLVAAAVNDPGGELLAVMLKAMRLDDIQARQVFLLASPIGKDVATFFPLTDLYSGLEPSVAEALVGAWRSPGHEMPATRHEPHFSDHAAGRRPAAGEPRQAAIAHVERVARRA